MSRRRHHRGSPGGSEATARAVPSVHPYRAALIGCGRMGAFIDHERTSPHAFSHAAGYLACSRNELVALSDPRAEVMDRAGERYGVAPAHRYRNYREMLENEWPDIVSVATQREQRAAIVIWAGEHGGRAIYAEKPMAASLEQADAMVAAVERYGVAFNMGTNRRWETPYDTMKELIGGGRYGRLLSMTIHQGAGLFNMGSHAFDRPSRRWRGWHRPRVLASRSASSRNRTTQSDLRLSAGRRNGGDRVDARAQDSPRVSFFGSRLQPLVPGKGASPFKRRLLGQFIGAGGHDVRLPSTPGPQHGDLSIAQSNLHPGLRSRTRHRASATVRRHWRPPNRRHESIRNGELRLGQPRIEARASGSTPSSSAAATDRTGQALYPTAPASGPNVVCRGRP